MRYFILLYIYIYIYIYTCIYIFIGDLTAIRDACPALEVLDIDGDGVIGLLDFIHFAARLKAIHHVRIYNIHIYKRLKCLILL
jgi:hypothetical protein